MRYLCEDHWESLQHRSEQDLKNYCVRWLSLAHRYRAERSHRQALAFAGCAWDVGGILVRRYPGSDWSLPVLLALGGITLASQLRELDRARHAEEIIDQSCGRMADCHDKTCPCWRASLKALTQESLWPAFLQFHLGIPDPQETRCYGAIRHQSALLH